MSLQVMLGTAIETISEEKLQEQLNAAVQKVISEELESAISGYHSPFRESIKQQIHEKLEVNKIDFETYNATIKKQIEVTMKNEALSTGQKHLAAILAELTEKAPESVKLSELVEAMKSDEHGLQDDTECTATVKDEGYATRIYLDPEADKDNYDCKFRLSILSDNEVLMHEGALPNAKLHLASKIRKYIFWLTECGTKLIIDEPDIEYPEKECHC